MNANNREDGPAIANFLNGLDGGNRPTTLASIAGTHVAPEHGLTPQVANPGLDPEEEGIDIGPVHYAHKLHEAGEAAIAILGNMCESEFAMGNPRNLPEPILGWYCMTLAYQLMVLEACQSEASSHAGQLHAALAAFEKYTGPYANSVREEVADSLGRRKAWSGADTTYGGKLPAAESVVGP